MRTAAITTENLGKRYSIHRPSANEGMRHAIEGLVRSPRQSVRAWRSAGKNQEFWALKNVSLTIRPGEVVGIIGRNGAGKSTLLKLLSRITVPTLGRIAIAGRVASLLEVGTGFHQELTGRENIFLNGAILGMTHSEIVSKFDEIVEFSEVAEFLDTPVKRYSSGMYIRLAFAVAAHLDPEILIIDEVLAVGDAAFQKKCLSKMGSFAERGKTVLFVSHNMEAVTNLCTRAVWLKDGQLFKDGSVEDTVEAYFRSTNSSSFHCENAEYGFAVRNVALRNHGGDKTTQFVPGEDLTVEISYEAQEVIESPIFAIGIFGTNGSCFTSNMLLDGHRPKTLFGKGCITCTFKAIPLLPQNYTVKLIVRAATVRDIIIKYQEVASFSVAGDLACYGFKGDFITWAVRSTPVVVPYEWRLPDGSRSTVALTMPRQ
jgi:lipopolysaccharide transport system ATP-binding protein